MNISSFADNFKKVDKQNKTQRGILCLGCKKETEKTFLLVKFKKNDNWLHSPDNCQICSEKNYCKTNGHCF